MAAPQITTVIPTYRRPDYLVRAVKSALAQTMPDLRVAVFDNASGDATGARMKALADEDPRVAYHCRPENVGGPMNFKLGLESVTTPYFSLLSDDDVLLPGFYEYAMRLFDAHPEAAFVCGQSVMHNPDAGTHRLRPRKKWEPGVHPPGAVSDLVIRSPLLWTSALFRTEAVRGLELLVDSYLSDVVFLAQAAARAPVVIAFVPFALFTTWEHGAYASIGLETLRESCESASQAIAATPGLTTEQRASIDTYLATKPRERAGRTLQEALLRGDWERFDEAATFLKTHGTTKWRQRWRMRVGRMRGKLPFVVSGVRRVMGGRRALRRRARMGAGGGMTTDEVVAHYAAILDAALAEQREGTAANA